MKLFFTFLALFLGYTLFAQDSADSNSYGINSNDFSNTRSNSSNLSSFGMAVDENYILKSSDVIQIEVFQEPDLEKAVRIEGDGTVTLPLVKKVKVADLTISEAQDLITQLYNRDFLVDPQINVIVINFAPKKVQVLGSVNRPGVVEMPPDSKMTLTEAIGLANDVNRLGNRKSISIKRIDESGHIKTIPANFDKILTDENYPDIILQEGDIIYVPERRI